MLSREYSSSFDSTSLILSPRTINLSCYVTQIKPTVKYIISILAFNTYQLASIHLADYS